MAESITVNKYTFVVPDEDYRVHCHRNGEIWYIFDRGSNAIRSLLCRIEELEREKEELERELEKNADIETASGHALDILGNKAGVTKGANEPDDAYRCAIQKALRLS